MKLTLFRGPNPNPNPGPSPSPSPSPNPNPQSAIRNPQSPILTLTLTLIGGGKHPPRDKQTGEYNRNLGKIELKGKSPTKVKKRAPRSGIPDSRAVVVSSVKEQRAERGLRDMDRYWDSLAKKDQDQDQDQDRNKSRTGRGRGT